MCWGEREWRIVNSEWKRNYFSILPIRYPLLPLILRPENRRAGGVAPQPAGRRQPLLRKIAALVIHLLRALDPVTEIDVRQSLPAGAGDVIEDHEGAERAA